MLHFLGILRVTIIVAPSSDPVVGCSDRLLQMLDDLPFRLWIPIGHSAHRKAAGKCSQRLNQSLPLHGKYRAVDGAEGVGKDAQS